MHMQYTLYAHIPYAFACSCTNQFEEQIKYKHKLCFILWFIIINVIKTQRSLDKPKGYFKMIVETQCLYFEEAIERD